MQLPIYGVISGHKSIQLKYDFKNETPLQSSSKILTTLTSFNMSQMPCNNFDNEIYIKFLPLHLQDKYYFGIAIIYLIIVIFKNRSTEAGLQHIICFG